MIFDVKKLYLTIAATKNKFVWYPTLLHHTYLSKKDIFPW